LNGKDPFLFKSFTPSTKELNIKKILVKIALNEISSICFKQKLHLTPKGRRVFLLKTTSKQPLLKAS
jgi:hypothetical protein